MSMQRAATYEQEMNDVGLSMNSKSRIDFFYCHVYTVKSFCVCGTQLNQIVRNMSIIKQLTYTKRSSNIKNTRMQNKIPCYSSNEKVQGRWGSSGLHPSLWEYHSVVL